MGNNKYWRNRWGNRSLRSKFLIIFIAVVIGFNLGFFALWQPKANQFIVDKLSKEVRRQLLTLGDGILPFLIQNQIAGIHETLDAVKERQDNWVEIELFDAASRKIYPLSLSKKIETQSFVRLTESIVFRGEVVATITASVDFSQEQASLKRQGYALFAGATGLFVFAMLIVAVFFEVLVGRRAVQLSNAADSLAKGNFNAELPTPSGDEIGRLVKSFAEMRETVFLTQNSLSDAREQAESATKAKSQFLAVMSHEIRTPLNGLLGTIQLMQTTELTEQQNKYLSVMISSGEFLKQHVDDVLDLSRPEAGKVEIIMARFDLKGMVQDIADGMRHFADQRGNTLIMNVAPDVRYVWGDARRIRQVLYNLLSNAIKFTRDGKISIEVLATDDDQMQCITVTDTGIGIAAKNIDRIFFDFETVDTSHSRDAGGTGLGLGISQRFAKAMGGKITAASELGKGSCFQFTWKAEATAQELPPPPAPATDLKTPITISDTRLKILVVEDNKINRFVVHEMLKKAGHAVYEAENGRIGTEMAAAEKYDVILMDISMPEMDGIQATKIIRSGKAASSNSPIIALTAYSTPEDRTLFLNAGMNETLLKPLSYSLLIQTLASAKALSGSPTTKAGVAEAEIVDVAHFNQMIADIGQAKIVEFFTLFSTEVSRTMEKLKIMADTGWDLKQAAEIIHKLAGSAAMFGAVSFQDQLAEAEAYAKNGDEVGIEELLPKLRQTWKNTIQIIEKGADLGN